MATLTEYKPRDIYELTCEYVRENMLTICTDLTDSMLHYHPIFKSKYWDIVRPMNNDEGRDFNHSFLVTFDFYNMLRVHGECVMYFEGQYFWFRDKEKIETPLGSDPIVQIIAIAGTSPVI